MGKITQAALAQAVGETEGMSLAQKVNLVDKIFGQQPNLLASVLVLSKMG